MFSLLLLLGIYCRWQKSWGFSFYKSISLIIHALIFKGMEMDTNTIQSSSLQWVDLSLHWPVQCGVPSQGLQGSPTWASASLKRQSVIQKVKTHAGDSSSHFSMGGSLNDGMETVLQAPGCVRHLQSKAVLWG